MRCPWVSYSLHHHHIKVWAGLVTERTYHFERGKEWKHWKRLNRKIRTCFLFVLFCFLNVERVKKNRSSLSLDFVFFLSLYKISIYCHYYSAFFSTHFTVLRTMYVTNKGSWILNLVLLKTPDRSSIINRPILPPGFFQLPWSFFLNEKEGL